MPAKARRVALQLRACPLLIATVISEMCGRKLHKPTHLGKLVGSESEVRQRSYLCQRPHAGASGQSFGGGDTTSCVYYRRVRLKISFVNQPPAVNSSPIHQSFCGSADSDPIGMKYESGGWSLTYRMLRLAPSCLGAARFISCLQRNCDVMRRSGGPDSNHRVGLKC